MPDPTETPTPAPAPAEKPTQAIAAPKQPAPVERSTVEELAAEKQTPAWLFAAAKMKHSWPVGKELTANEYDQAIKAAAGELLDAPEPKAKKEGVS